MLRKPGEAPAWWAKLARMQTLPLPFFYRRSTTVSLETPLFGVR